MNFKRILSLALALVLLLGALGPVSPIRAAAWEKHAEVSAEPEPQEETEDSEYPEDPEDPEEPETDPLEEMQPQLDWIAARWPLEILEVKEISSSQLKSGTAYAFRKDVTLTLDQDLDCGPIVCGNSLTIQGEATLRCPIFYGDSWYLDDGTVQITPLDELPDPELNLINGIYSLAFSVVRAGQLDCPNLQARFELSIGGGQVNADSIWCENYFTQTGGRVTAKSISSEWCIEIYDGSLETWDLRCGRYESLEPDGEPVWIEKRIFTNGGTILYHCTPGEKHQSFEIVYPATVLEPAPGVQDYDHILTGPLDLQDPPFTDVEAESYYTCAVSWGYNTKLIQGVAPDRFGPQMICSRSQVVTFLWRAAGSPAPKSQTNPFRDVPAGTWYTDAVLWAVEQGITKGTAPGLFSPETGCSRAEVVTFLWRFFDEPEAEWSELYEELPEFADVQPGSFYYDAVNWAYSHYITSGVGGNTFAPFQLCDRAQIVTFLERSLSTRLFVFE